MRSSGAAVVPSSQRNIPANQPFSDWFAVVHLRFFSIARKRYTGLTLTQSVMIDPSVQTSPTPPADRGFSLSSRSKNA